MLRKDRTSVERYLRLLWAFVLWKVRYRKSRPSNTEVIGTLGDLGRQKVRDLVEAEETRKRDLEEQGNRYFSGATLVKCRDGEYRWARKNKPDIFEATYEPVEE